MSTRTNCNPFSLTSKLCSFYTQFLSLFFLLLVVNNRWYCVSEQMFTTIQFKFVDLHCGLPKSRRQTQYKTHKLHYCINKTVRKNVQLTDGRLKFNVSLKEKELANFNINTAQKMKFSAKDVFSKCEEVQTFLRICLHLLKKSLMKNFIFSLV